MPLPGGSSDKIGNRYEDRWTVACAFNVLDGRAEAIRLEPPGPENDGVEFWVRFTDRVEYHQCKRQRTGEGHWTLGALKSAKVLSAFLAKLGDPDAHCIFASTHAADQLDELAERARRSESVDEFTASLLPSSDWQAKFEALRRAWGDAASSTAFDALRRISVSTIGEAELKYQNRLQAELILSGDIGKSVAVLTEILRDHEGEYLTSGDLWRALKKEGYEPNPWRATAGLAVSVDRANQRFCASREDTLINGSLIERLEAEKLRSLVQSEPVVVVHGNAGVGKSDVLLQFIRRLEVDGVPYLAVRLDRITPTLLPDTVETKWVCLHHLWSPSRRTRSRAWVSCLSISSTS